ncbi:hypothetical protein STCU_11506 [Strigomonas culicis]|uniref:Uncharacterized protein n=1 Tax=Strigomonas culicis TaxID=28005 RepID=S9TGZ6_9TRYP|nr:hypothetical protein STCU_11506 [Strigomonas culicis]|eukprot:EPY16169.1 hypothetical protein STCU_11506 [Strigomonas culicis]
MTRRCFLVLFLAAVCLCFSADAATLGELRAAPRNIAQACRDELTATCDHRYNDFPDCLLTHFKKVKSPTCKTWLLARSICNSFVKNNNKCGYDQTIFNYRECIRNVPLDELPVQCRESDYYKSLKRFRFE